MSRTSPPRAALARRYVALVGAWAAIGMANRPRRPPGLLVSDVGLPAIDRGLRDQDPPRRRTAAAPRRSRVAHATARRCALARTLRGSVIVKFKDGADARRRSALRRAVAATAIDRPSTRTSTSSTSPTTPIPKPPRPRCARGPTSSTRSRAIATTRCSRPNDPLYAESVELPAPRHGARVGHPARRRAAPSSSRSSTPAWRSGR